MSTSVLSRRKSSALSDPKTPQLPLEIIWSIIEQSLLQLSRNAQGKDNSIAVPVHLITLNRVIYELIIKLVYRTVILSSSRAVAKFLSFLTSCPNAASLVQNLWIGTSRLEVFAHQVGWVSCAVKRILAKAKNIRRLALPAPFYPIGLSEVSIDHLTVNGSGFTELPIGPNTLHVYGLVQSEVVRRAAKKGLRRVLCEFRRPCAPGAVGRLVRDLLGYGELGLKLNLLALPGLKAWVDMELVEVQDICSYVTVEIVQKEYSSDGFAEEWARGYRGP